MPAGPFDAAREQMLRKQLRHRGIRDPRVLAAMAKVARDQFVAESVRDQAYEDRALAIDCQQTISQPYIVALMTEALQLTGTEHVLEIGTGSGYQTAVLAELAHDVVSIERHADLAERAQEALEASGYTNVKLLVGDGTQGFADAAPYDRILVAAASSHVPPALAEQLAEGGILVIPLGGSEGQVLESLRKQNGKLHSQQLSGCRFVPLVFSP